jgi:hypothetical protein
MVSTWREKARKLQHFYAFWQWRRGNNSKKNKHTHDSTNSRRKRIVEKQE